MASFRTPQIAALTGATPKELDYWHRINLIWPSVSRGNGPGCYHGWDEMDARVVRALVVLRDAGVSLTTIRRLGVHWVLRDPYLDWDGYLVILDDSCFAVTNPAHAVATVGVEAQTVTVLPLRTVTLLAEPAIRA